MGEGTKQFQEFDQLFSSNSSESSSSSVGSSSSDLTEDATSPFSSYNSSVDSNGPLYELDSLMNQLPIKRGLSKYYQGKSQSFTSLSNVRCVEDLPKKENGYNKRMKSCRSYAGGLDGSNNINRSCCAPRPCNKIISKNKGCSRNLSSSFGSRRCGSGTFVSGRIPPVPVQKK